MIKSKSFNASYREIIKRVGQQHANEMDIFFSNLHTIAALFDLFQHVSFR